MNFLGQIILNVYISVLSLVQSLLMPTSPEDLQEQALRCFSSWVEFGVPIMEGEPVILQVFQLLNNPHLFDSAVESLVNVFSHQDSHRCVFHCRKSSQCILTSGFS